MKEKKKTKKAHRHKWLTGDCCFACGAYEAYCKGCDTIGMFGSNGQLIDTNE